MSCLPAPLAVLCPAGRDTGLEAGPADSVILTQPRSRRIGSGGSLGLIQELSYKVEVAEPSVRKQL